MGRNRGFTGVLIQLQREAERRARQDAASQRRAVQEAQRAQREYERAVAADQKERKRLYEAARMAEVGSLNESLMFDVRGLQTLLRQSLAVDDFLDFETLKDATPLPGWEPGDLATPIPPPDQWDFRPTELTGMQKLVPGAQKRYEVKYEQGRLAYQAAVDTWTTAEAERKQRLDAAWTEHQRATAAAQAQLDRQHAEIEAFKSDFKAGRPNAVTQYFAMVLELSRYPEGFPQRFRLAYVPESRQLVVQYQLPTFDRVPGVAEYKYVRTGDKITERARPARERQELYKSIIAHVTVRTLHEIFEADRHALVGTMVFNGHVDTINAATGQPDNPCLVTLMTSREAFLDRDFVRVDPLACLLDLSASVSKSPAELVPVRPVLDFNMVDPRFVEEADVLSGLDQRPNLMELKAGEFETLITNLFAKMGLETRQTRPSRDGGVDCVAFDNRPIFGGKVIIQAKRYKNTVPVTAVRDLFGSVHNEGASKGILVTTSGYGKASFDFAKNKPLELLSGSNLLYLLKVHADIDAKIEPPEHWVEPRHDTGSPHWVEPGDPGASFEE
jgi:restriction system protein